jgi:hypothetical protein
VHVSSGSKPEHTDGPIPSAEVAKGAPVQIPSGLPVANPDSDSAQYPSPLSSGNPIATIDAIDQMKIRLGQALASKDTITFLTTSDDGNYDNWPVLSMILTDGCRTAPRQCWFARLGDERDLDRSRFRGSGKRGITLHGNDLSELANAMGRWFTVYTTSSVPAELNGYKDRSTKEIIWIEVGPGLPWRPAPPPAVSKGIQ